MGFLLLIKFIIWGNRKHTSDLDIMYSGYYSAATNSRDRSLKRPFFSLASLTAHFVSALPRLTRVLSCIKLHHQTRDSPK